jgi:hypothetical protein
MEAGDVPARIQQGGRRDFRTGAVEQTGAGWRKVHAVRVARLMPARAGLGIGSRTPGREDDPLERGGVPASLPTRF